MIIFWLFVINFSQTYQHKRNGINGGLTETLFQSSANYLYPIFYPDYGSITVYINKSLSPSLSCSGNVIKISTKTNVYSCDTSNDCRYCNTFTVPELEQNELYTFNINANSSSLGIHDTIRTLHFWDYNITVTNVSLYVTIINYSTLTTNCTGTIKDTTTGKTIYTCENHPDCNMCRSFEVNNLVPGTRYDIHITSSYPKIFINGHSKTLYTFDVRIYPSFNKIQVDITRNDSLPMTCTGYVQEVNTKSNVFNCALNENCKTCKSFSVLNLKQNTSYKISIHGNYYKIGIDTLVMTTIFWTYEVIPNDNSLQVYINQNISIPIYCTGHIWNLNDSILVFNCSNDYFCQSCQNFTVYGLYANTMYEVAINSTKPDLNITVPYLNLNVNVTTTYHLSPIFVQNYTSISVVMNRSINLTAECHGNVYAVNTLTPIYTCERNYYCRLCVNFTIPSIKENQEYVFDIYSTPEGVYPQNLSTLNFWDVITQSTLNSILVNITLHSHIPVECSGYLFDQQKNIIFDCGTDKNCKKCHSFIITGLHSNEDYILNITTNFSNVNFVETIKTDKIFDVSTNISFFSIAVEATRLKNFTTYCSGSITLYGTNQTVYSCEQNIECSSCEDFTVDGLKENTKYNASIYVNGTSVFLKNIYTTKPLWIAKFLTSSKSITVNFNRVYKDDLICYGTITEVSQGSEIFNCTDNANCSECKTFTQTGLMPDTEYNINIKSTINHTGVDQTVRTMKLLTINYTATFDKINISMIKDSHVNISCSGTAYNNATKDVIFTCEKNSECKNCESFEMTGLNPKTAYVLDIKVNDTGANIILPIETDIYALKVEEIIPQLTSISVKITPNYIGGGFCNLTLYDKLMNKTNLTCSTACPTDCDKLSFQIIDLDINSNYTLSIENKYMQEIFSVSLFTSIINYTLNLVYMSETKFIISPYANKSAKPPGICNFTILHLQTGNMTYFSNNCTNIEKYDIQKGESYHVTLRSSLSATTIKPLIVYTLPIQPESIQFYQLNNTALDVKAKINITQPAPVNFRIKLYDDQHQIIMIDSYIRYLALYPSLASEYRDVEAIVHVVPYILINIGTCTFINTSFCLTAKEEFCSSCVYTRVPIFYIKFYYPGDVTFVSVGENPTKLRIVLPQFNPNNKWVSKCSIFIAKVLNFDSISAPSPPINFDINHGVYDKNVWALSYQSYNIVTCETAANITFGDKTDKNQLHLNFVKDNLYYVGFLQLCRHITCVSSKYSNIIFLLSQKNLNKQYILFIVALILGASILCFILTSLFLRNIGKIQTGIYKVKSTERKPMAGPTMEHLEE